MARCEVDVGSVGSDWENSPLMGTSRLVLHMQGALEKVRLLRGQKASIGNKHLGTLTINAD